MAFMHQVMYSKLHTIFHGIKDTEIPYHTSKTQGVEVRR
jgi:hypothetical protein